MLARIQREGGASLADLAREHAVSPVTVHRDLEHLNREGLVERVRGGALATSEPPLETGWAKRLHRAGLAKDAIALYARSFVADGATIFIDASSTGLALAHRLEIEPPAELTMITNSPAIVLGLTAPSVHVISTPGDLNQHTRALTGPWTTEFISRLHLDTAFISPSGINLSHGLTAARRETADIVNAVRAVTGRVVGLVPAEKFDRAALLTIVPAHELDAVITDDGVAAEVRERYGAAGVPLHVAKTGAVEDD